MEEEIPQITDGPNYTPLIVGVVTFGIGLGVGYFLGRRKPKEVYVIPAVEDNTMSADQMRDFIDKTEKELDINDPVEEIVVPNRDGESEDESDETTTQDDPTIAGQEFLAQRIQREMTRSKDEETEEQKSPGPVNKSVFATAKDKNDGWNYEEELKTRNNEQPYVIHEDEYFENEHDFGQSCLTYYAGDDIMVDEGDHPVYNHNDVVGPLKFGHGSGDKNVFFVRNAKRHAEYEIIKDSGLYSVEVLGMEIEDNDRVKNLKHDNVPKFRIKEE